MSDVRDDRPARRAMEALLQHRRRGNGRGERSTGPAGIKDGS